MITILLIILAVSITFLVTDFRRHLEIESLEAAHAAEMDTVFEEGYKFGHVDGLLEMRSILKPTPTIVNY